MDVWVIWHMYGDGSSAHIERVYMCENRAASDFALLQKTIVASEWKLDKIPMIDERSITEIIQDWVKSENR